MDPGPERTAALVAWFQGLFEDRSEAPVLVGGGAVELYTGGAYVTGDLDFVGSTTDAVAERLHEEGFKRKGRHWVHEEGGIFIELPARSFDRVVRVDSFRIGDWTIRILSPEDILVDRLAAWTFWRSSVNGVNAYLIWRDRGKEMDLDWLARLAKLEGVEDALARLRDFAGRDRNREEVEAWAHVKR
ncbi:MAG TPA: hypothetical protein VFG78_13320 [Gemmatimonadota bacterium]|nr:hypothetical protein [Gemmatimonadota bacterium]